MYGSGSSTTSPITATTAAAARAGSRVPTLARDGFTYVVPSPLPAGRPGALIATSDAGPDPVVAGADRRLLLYRSSNAAGHAEAVSAVLFMPRGRAPAGGWPVIAWAHGTTGIADRCAPSEMPNLFYDEYAQLVRLWLRAGYAVVATDYIGLGTPGIHSYLVGEDEGNAVIDSVTAARVMDPRLSSKWFAVGHSQGGQAVLFAARSAAARAPSLHLEGTVSIAPASALKAILPAVLAGDKSDLSYAVYALIGLSTIDARIHLDQLLGPVGRRALPVVLDQKCLDQTDSEFTSVPPAQTLRLSAAEITRLSNELDRLGDPDTRKIGGSVLVVQGAADQDVPALVTDAAVRHLRAFGSAITYRRYPGLGHDAVIGPSSCDVLAWLAAHGGPGGPAVRSCTPEPSAH